MITHDPLTVRIGTKDVFVDLGAERFLAAERAGRKIALEIKSFVGASEVRELELTLGQFLQYGDALARKDPDRVLHVAVRAQVFRDVFQDSMGAMVLENGVRSIAEVERQRSRQAGIGLRFLKMTRRGTVISLRSPSSFPRLYARDRLCRKRRSCWYGQ